MLLITTGAADARDAAENELALREGLRLLSTYRLADGQKSGILLGLARIGAETVLKVAGKSKRSILVRPSSWSVRALGWLNRRKAGLTPQHVQDLQDIGRLLKSLDIQSTNQLMNVLMVTKVAIGRTCYGPVPDGGISTAGEDHD